MASKIVLVTGANDGIGYEIAKQIAQLDGHKVYVGARSADKGKAAVEKINQETHKTSAVFVQIEVTDPKSVAAAAKVISDADGRLDILVNNAGIGHIENFAAQLALSLDIKLVRECMEVNFFGTISVTDTFLPLLKKSSLPVVVFVSTDMASTTSMALPNTTHHVVAYNTSKAALNSYCVALAHTFTEAKVNSVTPGYTATKLNGFTGPKSAENGAALIVKYALIDKDGPTSKFFDENGERPW